MSSSLAADSRKLSLPLAQTPRTREINSMTGFAQRQLAAAGLEAVAETVSSGAPIDEKQALSLLKCPLPLLVKVLELSPTVSERNNQVADRTLHPLFYFPLSESLTSRGLTPTVDQFKMETERTVEEFELRQPLSIAIDEWSGKQPSDLESHERLLDCLGSCLAVSAIPLSVVGPSTGELKTLFRYQNEDEMRERLAAAYFLRLRNAGVTALHGGSDISMQRLASAHGLRIAFAHNIARHRISRSDVEVESKFLAELFQVREQLLNTGNLDCWFPWSPVMLDSTLPKVEAPLGLEIMLSVAIARLVLPEVSCIRAPISLFGIRAAEFAYRLGANDFGYTAIDARTSEQLGLLRWSLVLAELQLSDR